MAAGSIRLRARTPSPVRTIESAIESSVVERIFDPIEESCGPDLNRCYNMSVRRGRGCPRQPTEPVMSFRRNPTQLQFYITDDAIVLIQPNNAISGWRVTFDALKATYAESKSGSDTRLQIQSFRESYRSVARGWSVRCDLDRQVRDLLKDAGDRLSPAECIEMLRVAGPIENRRYDLRAR